MKTETPLFGDKEERWRKAKRKAAPAMLWFLFHRCR
jgi:hypothetical protein